MTPIPYLFFPGTCEEALRAYARAFGSPEPELMREADAPPGASMGGEPHHVLHGCVRIGDGLLYASDWSQARPMAGSSICLTAPDTTEGRRLFDALSGGGAVEMPYAPTFWSPGFGAFTDGWGTRWMIDTAPQPAAQPAALPEAVA
ncbi:VOC family protein [Rubellimicrobium aerolatum]|uniref:VOC family protein n=1 Tax=Rubellimicrobium aerolatum TaxID=490979 RepID=A0ABW0SGZ8_9RHOB|nr:VOC family protein [Rubellimicrobium aerolatum]MBP1807346.1 PhnB protein [Rubellimicrobium aerolatum]